MNVQEFYDWCKKRNLTDAKMEISLKFAGQDLSGVKVTEMNIDYCERKCFPYRKGEKIVRLGG